MENEITWPPVAVTNDDRVAINGKLRQGLSPAEAAAAIVSEESKVLPIDHFRLLPADEKGFNADGFPKRKDLFLFLLIMEGLLCSLRI